MKKISPFLFFFLFLTITSTAQNKEKSDTVYNLVSPMPSFKGDLAKYLRNHLHYPQSAFDKNIEGTTYLSFIVTQTGAIKNVTVEKGVSPDLDSAAVAVLTSMPNWNPGKQNGKEVNVRCHLPVKFTIDNINHGIKAASSKQKILCDLEGYYYVAPYAGIGGVFAPFSNSQSLFTAGNNKLPLTYTSGLELGYMFTNKFGLFVVGQYQKFILDYSLTPNPDTLNFNTYYYTNIVTYDFSYFQTLLLARYISIKSGRVGFDLSAGFISDFLLNATESGNISQEKLGANGNLEYTTSINDPVNPVPKVINANKNNFGVALNLGMDLFLSNHLLLSLGILGTFNFSSAGNGGKDIVNVGYNPKYNYFQGDYGRPNSIVFNPKLIIRLGKTACPPPAEKQ